MKGFRRVPLDDEPVADDCFSPARTSVSFVFDSEPKPREMLIPEFLPARESGLLVATGGTGKGHFEIHLIIGLALGLPVAGFDAAKPRGVVMLSMEDDHDEMHRRIAAALDARYGSEPRSWREDVRSEFEKRVRLVDGRGAGGIYLGPDLREKILRVTSSVEDPGLVLIDPLTRLLPKDAPPGFLNSQEGAGVLLNEFDAIRNASGCAIIASHHSNKESTRNGGELEASAATGSKQLVDLSRWVINLKKLKPDEAADYGLSDGHYLEAAVPKTNYTAPISNPIIFRRVEGGALVHVEAKSKVDVVDQAVLTSLFEARRWLTRDQWEQAAKDSHGVANGKAEKSRTRLKAAGRIEEITIREGKKTRVVFAPSKLARRDGWPDAPKTIADVDDAS